MPGARFESPITVRLQEPGMRSSPDAVVPVRGMLVPFFTTQNEAGG